MGGRRSCAACWTFDVTVSAAVARASENAANGFEVSSADGRNCCVALATGFVTVGETCCAPCTADLAVDAVVGCAARNKLSGVVCESFTRGVDVPESCMGLTRTSGDGAMSEPGMGADGVGNGTLGFVVVMMGMADGTAFAGSRFAFGRVANGVASTLLFIVWCSAASLNASSLPACSTPGWCMVSTA